MPTAQAYNPVGVWGASSTAFTGQAEVFAAGATVTAGQPVMLSTSDGYVVPMAATTAFQKCVGIAIESAASGTPVQVCVAGKVFAAAKTTASAITQFNLVGISATETSTLVAIGGTTAITQAKDLGQVVGIAMASQTAGDTTVDVFVVRL